MGNRVTALGQIYPVEYYLVDYNNDFALDKSLGSTRFMKVARVKHRDAGYCVVKVYAINDPNLQFQEYIDGLVTIRHAVSQSGELNSLPFVQCLVNEKCIILMRQFIKYNLYDRLSTRPFLTSIEKRWIAYQLLRCIQSLHNLGLYHGDIKSENVLVTSFLWVTLADFASYKPVTLPENNPSDFSYFFDTSRRHCCNMAPERFVEPTNVVTDAEAASQTDYAPATTATEVIAGDNQPARLTSQMDLFSLGCVLAELFSDDTPNSSIFDLGQILMFKKNQYDPTKFVEDIIADERVRKLILNLTDLDPQQRRSTSYHLEQLVPSLFPTYFHKLYDYFAKLIPYTPDLKILTLDKDLDVLLECIMTEDKHGLLLPLILATSTLRSLKDTDAKVTGIRLCVKLIETSPETMSDYIMDRLLPYIMHMLCKSESRVRAYCVWSLNAVLKNVNELQPSDSNVFIDYILPNLMPLAHDRSTLVRISLASNIAELAEIAGRLLHEPAKVTQLQEAFGSIVSQIFIDPNSHVRRAVLNENLSKLCDFFGPEKTDEVFFQTTNTLTSTSKLIKAHISIKRQDTIGNSTMSNADQRILMSSLSRTARPRGILLAHLQEHKSAVNKLLVVAGTNKFISCSNDATIKFWDCTGVSTKPQVLFRSKQTFISPDAGAITNICNFSGTDTLLALSDCNNLHLLQLHSPSSHTRLLRTINYDTDTFGSSPELVTDMVALSPFTYATCSTSSNVRGYDLRLPTTSDVWCLKMDGSEGLITCMDGNEFCIACGTSSSVISLFDLRFYIRATSMSYPLFQDRMRKRIRRILLCNDEIYCSVDGNNEVSTWNCETASRTITLWASPAPCLSSTQSSHQSVLSLIVDGSKETGSVITAGDDMKIRFWDLNNPQRSYVMSRPAQNPHHKFAQVANSSAAKNPTTSKSSSTAKHTPNYQTFYQTKLVDGIQVIQETDKLSSSHANSRATSHHAMSSGASESNSSGASGAAGALSSASQLASVDNSVLTAAHHDSISCLATVNHNSLLLSASRDGVIKIWR